MPEWAKKKIKSRGGAKKYRTIKRGGKLIRIAITKKAGPRGGHSVGYKIPASEAKPNPKTPDTPKRKKKKKSKK